MGCATNLRALVVHPLADNRVAALTRICRKALAVADPDVARFIEERVPEVIERNPAR